MAKVFRKAFKQKVSFGQALKSDNYLSRAGGGRHPEQGEKQEQKLEEYNSSARRWVVTCVAWGPRLHGHYMGSNPSYHACELCNLEPTAEPLCASVSSFQKWK